MRQDHSALLWDMRLRKTIVAIRYIKIRHLYPTLIITPYAVIWEWLDQFIDDGFVENDITLLTGTKKQREKKLQNNSRIFIINHEGHGPSLPR